MFQEEGPSHYKMQCQCPVILYPSLRLSRGMNKSILAGGIYCYSISPFLEAIKFCSLLNFEHIILTPS